jgi:formate dehydrogenase major subunit
MKGQVVHQIGLPYHWSSAGLVRGDAANDLISFVGDPNVSIQESKALTATIEPGRRSRGRTAITSGPLVPAIDDMAWQRDLLVARHKAGPEHGFKAEEVKESNA